MARVLVLRPEPGASATVERACELGLDAFSIPLFVVEPVGWQGQAPDPDRFDGLLLTSANALRHGGARLQSLAGLRVYAVGEATAIAAREAGLDVAVVGNSGVDQLLGSIEPDLRLLHLCGADRTQPSLRHIESIIVYRSRELETPDLQRAQGAVALIHSPRAGRRFAELVANPASIAIAAISAAAANAVGTGWKSIDVADRPSDDALLALASRLCNNPDPK